MCFGMTMPIATLVPSTWSLTTLTVSSTGPFASLLHPATDHEVHRVSTPGVPAMHVLTDATPSRVFPSRAAVPVVAARPMPPRRHWLHTRPTSRPCSTRESVALCRRCQLHRTRYSHGLPYLKHRARRLLSSHRLASVCLRRFAPKRTLVSSSDQSHSMRPVEAVRPLRASSRPTKADRTSARSPVRRSVAPSRDAPTASLRARPGRHLAGASLRRPKTSHMGMTSRRGRRVTAVPPHQSVSADVPEKLVAAHPTHREVSRLNNRRPTYRLDCAISHHG